MEKQKIVALIITYGERQKYLAAALASLQRQTVKFDKIYIIDNGSGLETKRYLSSLDRQDIEIIIYAENIYSAAFGKGLANIYKQHSFGWIYLMDDDGYLKVDALEKLIQSPQFNSKNSFLTSLREDAENKVEQRGWFSFNKLAVVPVNSEQLKSTAVPIGHSSFMGMLINAQALKKVGFPRQDFILYMEDVEFCLRLRKYGPAYLIPTSVVQHTESASERAKIFNIGTLAIPRTKYQHLWRDYYGLRNLFPLCRQYFFFPLTFFIILYRLLRVNVSIIIFDDYKLRRIITHWQAFSDGLLNKLGKKKTSILFITMGRLEPASRFRVLQYLPLLKKDNFQCSVIPLNLFKTSFSAQPWITKSSNSIIIIIIKILTVLLVPFYDIIFLQRTVIKGLSPWIEQIIKKINPKIIFDLDDAIWLNYSKQHNPVDAIVKLSAQIICGNEYLHKHYQKINKRINILPTALDTEKYKPIIKSANKNIILGWIGTNVNLKYLVPITESFIKPLVKEFPQVKFRIVSNQKPQHDFGINTEYIPWSTAKEVELINSFDLGLMPLEDNDWTKGKCAFKAIQYMACGVATIASAVGVNKEVITDGIDGYLAYNNSQWYTYAKQLIINPQLRHQIGEAGRKKIILRYSIAANYPKFKKIISII